MKVQVSWPPYNLEADLMAPRDISIAHRTREAVNAFDLPDAQVEPFRVSGFTGRVAEGGSCNVDGLRLYPHGNGTHTEGLGHINREHTPLEGTLNRFFFCAYLCTATVPADAAAPAAECAQLDEAMAWQPEAIVVRTLSNDPSKKKRRYAGTRPIFLGPQTMQAISASKVAHLVVDLPSVDDENDARLTNHHMYWGIPDRPRTERTITELVYIPDDLPDGPYLLQMCPPPIDRTDAVPSRIILYALRTV